MDNKKKMRAAAITGIEKVELMEYDIPVPEADEVLIQNRACALCTWETRVFNGIKKMDFPYVEGHEVSGVIAAKGSRVSDEWEIGEKVIVRKFWSCGHCYFCRRGDGTQCITPDPNADKYDANGGFCEYMAVPASDLFKCGQDIPFEEAALAEPLACVIHSIEKGRIGLGDDVLVIGAGVMGLLHLKIAKLRGARVIVCEIDKERREKAVSLGADVVFSPKEEDFSNYVKLLTEGRGADVVFNTASSAEVSAMAIEAVAGMGRVIAYSSQHPDTPVGVKFGELHNREYEIIGSVSPTVLDFQKAAKLINMKTVDLKSIIDETVPFEKAQQAFEKAKPGAYRIVLKIGTE